VKYIGTVMAVCVHQLAGVSMKLDNRKNFWLGVLGLIGAGIFFVATKQPTAPDVVSDFLFGNTIILIVISSYFIYDGIGDAWKS